MVIKPEKRKIGARGQYVNCSFKEHLTAPGINSSTINTYIRKGPRAAKSVLDRTAPPTETKAMRIGKRFHEALLEPEVFAASYVPKTWNGTTKAGKARKAEVEERGQTPIEIEEWSLIIAMKGAVYQAAQERAQDKDPLLAELLLSPGRVEQSALWWDTEEDMPLKGRFDKVLPGLVVDIKTADQWMPDEWARTSALKYGYHRQAWMYCDAYEAIHGTRPRHLHVVVHNAHPYEVTLFELGEQELELGMEQVRKALGEIKERMAANRWHSDAERGVRPVAFPSWVYAQHEAREHGGEVRLTIAGEAVSL
jgi:hypothetical protein